MTEQHLTPGPDHPITIEPDPSRVVARVGDHIVADSTAALALREADYPPVYYIPMSDVDPSVLRRTDTITHCPYKGDASYFSLVFDDDTEDSESAEVTDAVWVYQTPYPAVSQIAGYAAFQPDKVQVTTS